MKTNRFETRVEITKGMTMIQTVEVTYDCTQKEVIADIQEFVANDLRKKSVTAHVRPAMVKVEKWLNQPLSP